MHKIRRIIEYHAVNALSDRQISQLTKISRPTVAQYLVNFQQSGIDLETFRNMSDSDALSTLTSGRRQSDPRMLAAIAFFPYMQIELKRVGVTRHLLWAEYREKQPDGFQYSQFCHHFKVWQGTLAENTSMHQEHRAGESAYSDWAGKLPLFVTDRDTGAKTQPEFFVSLLGASGYTYAEACRSQELTHWISASQHALEYFEGVPAALTPDAYKGAVTKACKYEPVINRTFQDFASHYGTVVLPARPYRPKDKALVEGMVRILYTRLFAPLRNHTFYSLEELNEALWQLLEVHNRIKLQRLELSRHDLWQRIEKPALQPLPSVPFEYRQYKVQKVPNTYHVRISEDDHYYSVPWRLLGKEVTVIYSGRTVEVYHDNLRQAFHRRLHTSGWSTNQEHMPDHHRFQASWSPQRITAWGAAAGPAVSQICQAIMERYRYPEHGYRPCIGIINLQEKWGKERLDRACRLALERQSPSYRAVKTILERNEDKLIAAPVARQPVVINHENIRGQAAYN